MKIYPRLRKLQQENGEWQVILEKSKNSSPKILFKHIDRAKANTYEKLYREGRIKNV